MFNFSNFMSQVPYGGRPGGFNGFGAQPQQSPPMMRQAVPQGLPAPQQASPVTPMMPPLQQSPLQPAVRFSGMPPPNAAPGMFAPQPAPGYPGPFDPSAQPAMVAPLMTGAQAPGALNQLASMSAQAGLPKFIR